MATIITKNGSGSAVPASLTQGELAINVDRGILYYGSGSANAVRTITASLALSASYLIGGGAGTPGGANTTIQFNDAGAFSGSGNFTFNKSTNKVSLTGSLVVTGSTTVSGSIGINTTADAQSLLHIDGGASVNRVIMDANNNVARIFSFRTDNSQRWAFRVDDNETGANAGANFQLRRYADDGSFIDAPISLNRATGNITIIHPINASAGITGSLFGSSSYALTASFALNGGGGGATILKKENITFASSSWVSQSLYVYTYTDIDIASSSSIVDYTPNTASFATVVNAIVYPTVVVTAGSASFFATNQPAANITGELVITNI